MLFSVELSMSFLITSDPECYFDQTIRGLRVTFACLQNEDSEQTRNILHHSFVGSLYTLFVKSLRGRFQRPS